MQNAKLSARVIKSTTKRLITLAIRIEADTKQPMDNLTQHFSNEPTFLYIFIVALVLVVISVPYFLKQQKTYGSAFEFASKSRKNISGISAAVLIGVLFYVLTPYVAPPTKEIAIVLGNTQNTPAPNITGDVSKAITKTMLLHQGDTENELADSIKVISAIKNPEVIKLDAKELKLRPISNNNSNAARSAGMNITAIEQKINTLAPTDNGANYLEAILEAHDNVAPGANIIVIGSGLSDEGDLNFAKSNLLTNKQSRTDAIQTVTKKYHNNYLDGQNVEFYGLGDTVKPQENLSSKQKVILREFYTDVIRGLGGRVDINTMTLVGDSVKTDRKVIATDTGCSDISRTFDDNSLKFVGDKSTFIDNAAAKNSLMAIKTLWDQYSGTIKSIQVDGYIAHPIPGNLSQQRADQAKQTLVELGIPSDKINATGKGVGPYHIEAQDRMVKITISRGSDECEN